MRAWITGVGALLLAPVLAVFSLRSLLLLAGAPAPWMFGPVLGVVGVLALVGLLVGTLGVGAMPRRHGGFVAAAWVLVVLGHFVLQGRFLAPLVYGGLASFLLVPASVAGERAGRTGTGWAPVAGGVLAVAGALLRASVPWLGRGLVFLGAGLLAGAAAWTGVRLLREVRGSP